MQDLRRQCAFGPRIPGTPPHAACRDWIKSEMSQAGLIVTEQPFKAHLTLINADAPAWNLWGLPAPEDQMKTVPGPFILISAHWDTRPIADRDPRGESGGLFLGANDGASGVALALELAREVKGTPLAKHTAFVFFDAEDSGVERELASWCLGSQFAAAHPPAWFDRLRVGINLDMIGGKETGLMREGYGESSAPEIIKRLWKIGRALAPGIFLDSPMDRMIDDHYPFVQIGKPYIDLIGLPYPYWHRSGDLPDQCDGQVMSAIGATLLEFSRREIEIK